MFGAFERITSCPPMIRISVEGLLRSCDGTMESGRIFIASNCRLSVGEGFRNRTNQTER